MRRVYARGIGCAHGAGRAGFPDHPGCGGRSLAPVPDLAYGEAMAIVYRAELTPGKQEIVTAWLARQPWSGVDDGDSVEMIGAYRFDDPDERIGIETHLVRRSDGTVLQVPLTYRGAELAGAEEHLAGEMEHSVLGHRWIYDATGDPVYAAALARTIVRGQAGADQFRDIDGTLVLQPSTVVVHGFGDHAAPAPDITRAAPSTSEEPGAGHVTTITTDGPALAVYRTPHAASGHDGHDGRDGQLTGRWDGLGDSLLLAALT
ncbi:MAG: hypothetical protein L0H60_01405 [Micrococcaceae bacterium]|nr:hypothetical protein [Micrococcaceae bacterium]